MKKWITVCAFLFSIALVAAQDHSGVWQGTLKIVTADGRDLRYKTIAKLNPVTGNPIIPDTVWYPYDIVIDSNTVHTRAKIEIIQSGNKMLMQLISYAMDNRQVTMYEFSGGPKGKDHFLLTGKTNLVNETQGQVPLFNLDGKFSDTNGRSFFKGIWRSQLSGNVLGYFVFERTAEPFTINPELVHRFLNPSNKETGPEEMARLPLATPLHDSIITTSFSIDASVVDNGIPDNDTLSIWLNGKLIEDNVVPGKKMFLFRAKLDEKEWNQLTIRCKSEGKIKGTGILLNINTDEALLKYNLVMYKHDQVDWVIGRTEKRQQDLNPYKKTSVVQNK